MKKIGIWIILVLSFLIVFILSINIYGNNKKITIDKAFKNNADIENGSLDINITKKIDDEQINILYKGIFDRNYNKENIFATSGDVGIEVESLELGIYAPITVLFNETIDTTLNVDEVYQTILEIPENNEKLHFSILPLFEDYNTFDFNLFSEYINKNMYKYLKENKDKFEYFVNDSQNITTGNIGLFKGSISSTDLNMILDLLKEDSINYENGDNFYNISEKIMNYIYDDYLIEVYVEYGYISKIELKNNETEINISIKNINFDKEVSIPDDYDSYGLDYNAYLEKTNYNILSLFGLNSDGSLNLNDMLGKHFEELIGYMVLCMEASESGDKELAETYITNMSLLIEQIETTENLKEEDKLLLENYIEVYGLLRQYTIIYSQQCFTDDERTYEYLDEELINTLTILIDKLNVLGINIEETFNEEIVEESSEIKIIGE